MIYSELSNFPDDVIEQWIEPYAIQCGWPPKLGNDGIPIDRWRYLLCLKPLSWWIDGQWEKCTGHVSIKDLSTSSKISILKMAHAYLTNTSNEYSESISDMIPRLDRISEFLQSEKVLPRCPILYESSDGLAISDGNHRLCMYYICYGYFNLPTPRHLDIYVEHDIEYWVYRK